MANSLPHAPIVSRDAVGGGIRPTHAFNKASILFRTRAAAERSSWVEDEAMSRVVGDESSKRCRRKELLETVAISTAFYTFCAAPHWDDPLFLHSTLNSARPTNTPLLTFLGTFESVMRSPHVVKRN